MSPTAQHKTNAKVAEALRMNSVRTYMPREKDKSNLNDIKGVLSKGRACLFAALKYEEMMEKEHQEIKHPICFFYPEICRCTDYGIRVPIQSLNAKPP